MKQNDKKINSFHVEQSESMQSCPACQSLGIQPYSRIKDFSISKEFFTIENCRSCGLLFTNPRPSEVAIGPYYASADYISHSETREGFINKLYHLIRKKSLKDKLLLINSFANGKNLLDVGCGAGEFIRYINTKGWLGEGVEVSENARSLAVSKGIKVYTMLPTEKTYNAISLWHVLEHVHQLDEYLDGLYKMLDEEGVLIIAVPNVLSHDAQYYKEHWAAWDVPRHLYHFSPASLTSLFENKGFRLHKIKPMKYDSYYVSLLSEAYKGQKGIKKFISAFISGFVSNYKANKTGNYSSLIYIFKK